MNENDNELLRKYKLERNGQAEVSLDKLNSLFNEARERYELFIDQTSAYMLFSMKSERYVPLTSKVIAENLAIKFPTLVSYFLFLDIKHLNLVSVVAV